MVAMVVVALVVETAEIAPAAATPGTATGATADARMPLFLVMMRGDESEGEERAPPEADVPDLSGSLSGPSRTGPSPVPGTFPEAVPLSEFTSLVAVSIVPADDTGGGIRAGGGGGDGETSARRRGKGGRVTGDRVAASPPATTVCSDAVAGAALVTSAAGIDSAAVTAAAAAAAAIDAASSVKVGLADIASEDTSETACVCEESMAAATGSG